MRQRFEEPVARFFFFSLISEGRVFLSFHLIGPYNQPKNYCHSQNWPNLKRFTKLKLHKKFNRILKCKTLKVTNYTGKKKNPRSSSYLPILQKLDVSSNALSDPIPPSLCFDNQLIRLILFSNSFDFELPWTLVNCTLLYRLRIVLFSNSFDFELPSTLANCTLLYRLRIEGNRVGGSIPFSFGLLPNLTCMDLSENNFSGEIQRDLGTSTSPRTRSGTSCTSGVRPGLHLLPMALQDRDGRKHGIH